MTASSRAGNVDFGPAESSGERGRPALMRLTRRFPTGYQCDPMFRNFLVAALVLSALSGARGAEDAPVSLAIVYDTSGSMRDPVRDSSGRRSPKYVIGNRALEAVIARVEAFHGKEGTPKKALLAGLFVF